MADIPVELINKVSQGSPHVVDAIRDGKIDLIINTPRGSQAHSDGNLIRGAAQVYGVPLVTTLSAATATVQGITALHKKPLKVISVQTHYQRNEIE
jgi:carbamoyl-phosphate synthase large subunit